MKMPITYGEYLEEMKEKHSKKTKEVKTDTGTWHIEPGCQEYHCQVILTEEERLNLINLTPQELVAWIEDRKLTYPLFPHIWYRDEHQFDHKGNFIFTRIWLDSGKARFVPNE